MVDEVLTGAPLLPLVRLRREPERPAKQVLVDVVVVGGDVRDELFDQLLVPLACFENRHTKSVLPGFRATAGRYRVEGGLSRPPNRQSPCAGAERSERQKSSRGCSSRSTTPRALPARGDPEPSSEPCSAPCACSWLGRAGELGLCQQRQEALRLEQVPARTRIDVEFREDRHGRSVPLLGRLAPLGLEPLTQLDVALVAVEDLAHVELRCAGAV